MAKVVITIEDGDDETSFVMESDPVFSPTGGENTDAQEIGLYILELLAVSARKDGALKRAIAFKDDGTETNLLDMQEVEEW